MSDATIETAGVETRQAMLRVWMAISAVWIAFWISIAGITVATGWMSHPFFSPLSLMALIIVAPPLVLLAIGTISRLIFETTFGRVRNS